MRVLTGPRTLAFKMLAATLAVAGGAFLLLSFAVYERTFVILDAELGRTLRAHAAALAAGLSPSELSLVLDGEGEESAVVRRIRDRLERFRAAAALSEEIPGPRSPRVPMVGLMTRFGRLMSSGTV